METGAIDLVALITPILNTVLIFIMFGLGTSLKIEDFKRLITEPKYMGLGLFNQLLILPLVGLAVISLFDLYVGVAGGIILILSCPGGSLSNLLTHFSKGDLALSISLTAVSTCCSVILLPFWIHLGFQILGAEAVPEGYKTLDVVLQVLGTTVAPVFVGMYVAYLRPQIVEMLEKFTRIFALSFLTIVLLGMMAKDPSGVVKNITTLVPLGFLFSIGLMSYGWLSARLAGIPKAQRRTITLETGIQNILLAITVASGSLNNLEMAVFPTLYGFAMIFVGLGVVFLSNFRKTKEWF
ncbi:MAG: bile acid:sodium symporter [Bacteroidota bacterium]